MAFRKCEVDRSEEGHIMQHHCFPVVLFMRHSLLFFESGRLEIGKNATAGLSFGEGEDT